MYSIHATRKLLDRVKRPVADPISEPSTMLGSWYVNALLWKPQVAVLVNERTLLPVLMPLAPAFALAERFAEQLGLVLEAVCVPVDFVAQELLAMEHLTCEDRQPKRRGEHDRLRSSGWLPQGGRPG